MLSAALLLFAVLPRLHSQEIICETPGFQAGSTPQTFIVCTEKDGHLVTVENKCSKGTVFDISTKSCTPPRLSIFAAVGNDNLNVQGDPPPPAPARRECKRPGALCSDCHTMTFCVGMGTAMDGTQLISPVLDLPCGDDEVCVTGSASGCVSVNKGGVCREGAFECGDLGRFPDPYSCTSYYDCVFNGKSTSGNRVDCTGLAGRKRWNPETQTCGWPEDTEDCINSPVPACNRPMEMGSAGGQIYYVCILNSKTHSLSPKLFRCPTNKVFNAIKYECEEPPYVYSTPQYYNVSY